MALAVEVRRLEDLADRADRRRREQHRAEDRLLGLEVLRRDDRTDAIGDPGQLGGAHRTSGVKPVLADGVQREPPRRRRAGRTEHMFVGYPLPGRPVDRLRRVVQPETCARSGKSRRAAQQGLWRSREATCRAGAVPDRDSLPGAVSVRSPGSASGPALRPPARPRRPRPRASGSGSSSAITSAIAASACSCSASASASARRGLGLRGLERRELLLGRQLAALGDDEGLHLDLRRPGRARSGPCSGRCA